MVNEKIDPKTHRMIHTRDGVATVPRAQQGVPVKEYFRNAELPNDLETAVVYVTENGPVLARPDPVEWNQEHSEQAKDYAWRIKAQIDEVGYYKRSLHFYAARLAEETGHPKDEMKAVIADAFVRENGKDPFTYLQEVRQAKGLPVRDKPVAENSLEQDHQPIEY